MLAESPAAHGLEELVQQLDRAVGAGTPQEIGQEVKAVLVDTTRHGRLELTDACRRPIPGRYARRLLHLSPGGSYSLLAMIWGPGQATPLHDHAGMWCVEGVYQGAIEVTQYDLAERQGERYRFDRQGRVTARPGSAGALIPPFEYHTIANPGDEVAITLHVYGGEMISCTVFERGGDGWWERRRRDLAYD